MGELLRVEKLEKHFVKESGFIKKKTNVFKAVNDVSFHINVGETLGLVGESGCGKSTTGKMIVDLIQPTSGDIYFDGVNIAVKSRDRAERLKVKRNIQMIFQDSYASLDPRMTAGEAVEEALNIHKLYPDRKERRVYIESIFADAGLSREQIDRYPHEFSGGQRQRIGIARAISLQPKIIICDEPVSALDVSIQAQIINNMESVQEKYGISYLFISHDLSVVKHISDRVIVMYLGYLFEDASKEELFAHPLHPYTQALVEATPSTNPDIPKRSKPALKNEIDPSLIGVCCPFANRCEQVTEHCRQEPPEMKEAAPGHLVRCHLF